MLPRPNYPKGTGSWDGGAGRPGASAKAETSLTGVVHAQPAAVDIDGFAGDVARLRARQEGDDVRHLGRLADALEGVRDITMAIASGLALTPAIIAVSMEPGPTALTRMPCSASASALARVSCMTPPLEAQ